MRRFNPDIHHRHSIRLRRYNYEQAGYYFVTVCTQGRGHIFGNIKNGKMILNDVGRMVQEIWDFIPKSNDNVDIDTFQIMPNHIHGIIIIVGAAHRGRPKYDRAGTGPAPTNGTPLSDVMYYFKSMTTRQYIIGIDEKNWPMFNRRLWQRNYYEHIIRNEYELRQMREYVVANPANWENDEENVMLP
jgi:REP element-mobilizing transposase RayT